MLLNHVDILTERAEIARSLKALERVLSPEQDLYIAEAFLEKSEGHHIVESILEAAQGMLCNDQRPDTPDGWAEVLTLDQLAYNLQQA